MKINSETLLFAVLGNPVAHSLSPAMHNAAFKHVGYNGVYLAFNVEDIRSAVFGIRALGIRGVSVTIPHKISVMGFLDQIDHLAVDIGAVNTIVNHHGKLIGHNTDCSGAVQALLDQTSIEAKEVVIIGAGGAARAIGFGVKAEGGKVTIVNRSVDKGQLLARDLNSEFKPFSELKTIPCQILINTTPLGMAPYQDKMPVEGEVLESDMVVMDTVYNPLKTRLLKEAQRVGCKTVNGLSMFVYQGAFQFELWTGKKAPVEIMKKTASNILENQEK